jgi:hypothetical protein
MLEFLNAVMHSHAFQGVVIGVSSAAATDYHAFKAFRSWDDLVRYRWGLAMFRWFQGAVIGILSGSVLGSYLG